MELHPLTLNYMDKTSINKRKKLGQYFTPSSLRTRLLSKIPVRTGLKILDPGCGTGEFLLSASARFPSSSLYGWDVDASVLDVCKEVVPSAKVLKKDTLLSSEMDSFDLIVGNPPYFEFKADGLKERYKPILYGRPNIYAFFIYRSLQMLRIGGYLAFVCPPSMNNGAYFSKLRSYIVSVCNIEFMEVLDSSLFEGANQAVMLLVLRKGKNKNDYVFRRNGLMIFSAEVAYLEKAFRGKKSLSELGYTVRTGRVVWNQHKSELTDDSSKILLIWSHNIT